MTFIPRLPLSVLVVFVAVISGLACTPPCEPITSRVTGMCHVPDAGPIAPDASFALEGQSEAFGSCVVAVDGGAISLEVTGGPVGCGSAPANGVRAPGALVRCTFPPLAPGVYTVNSFPAVTLTLPGDGGVQSCPR